MHVHEGTLLLLENHQTRFVCYAHSLPPSMTSHTHHHHCDVREWVESVGGWKHVGGWKVWVGRSVGGWKVRVGGNMGVVDVVVS